MGNPNKKNSKMIATETTEATEGKYSVLSVYSVAEKLYLTYIYNKKRGKKSRFLSVLVNRFMTVYHPSPC